MTARATIPIDLPPTHQSSDVLGRLPKWPERRDRAANALVTQGLVEDVEREAPKVK